MYRLSSPIEGDDATSNQPPPSGPSPAEPDPAAASDAARPVDARHVITRLRPAIQRIVGGSIDVALTNGSEPALVALEPGRLEAILIDLVVNAREAMPTGGQLDIDVRNAVDYVGPDVPVGGQRWVEISVSDSGVGIPSDLQTTILRMSVPSGTDGDRFDRGFVRVRSVIQRAAGRLELTSEVGRGTTVTLRLPWLAGAGE